MRVIIDSHLTKKDILKENPEFPCPQSILSQLTILEVNYFSFDKQIHQGQIVIDKTLADDIRDLFRLFIKHAFPLTSVIPISDDKFYWNDEVSMQANNTSGFNYRKVARQERFQSCIWKGRRYKSEIKPIYQRKLCSTGRSNV